MTYAVSGKYGFAKTKKAILWGWLFIIKKSKDYCFVNFLVATTLPSALNKRIR